MLTDDRELPALALKSLLYEVSVTPKPGLVDPANPGPHPDMTVFTFIDSAVSLESYFEQCRQAGAEFKGTDLTVLFQQIRPAGIRAEKAMFAATKGVNTHKGAVFSLGVLVTAGAYTLATASVFDVDRLFKTVRAMLVGLVNHDLGAIQPNQMTTAGERQYAKYGQGGIRAEAEAGYPVVADIALPFLRQQSGPLNYRLLDTLMVIAAHTTDTNLIKRAGTPDILPWMRAQTKQYFELGGSQTTAGWEFLVQLNQEFLVRNLSLGGSADLLILTIFVGLIEGSLE
ncbi:triphosphoribosyl-dephospho-CoA synthase CitG [Lactiplantibacillus herbarum]|uniref:triphosphoribosyl-dephospho-CoA synthase CitG n=1 Tax=Lactiplantibacillus herbarum TaxID=1670446 RepID=UPI00064E36A9|nr:triphosphoribosyl-dephospho-CoA synthase CitG [Lactiplantibacillus herbarum]